MDETATNAIANHRKPSKLAALAKARAQKREQNSSKRNESLQSVDILDRLASKSVTDTSTSPVRPSKPRKSPLSEKNIPFKRRLSRLSRSQSPDLKISNLNPDELNSPELRSQPEAKKALPLTLFTSYKVDDLKISLLEPSKFSVLFIGGNQSTDVYKKRTIETNIGANSAFLPAARHTISEIKENFAKPSPDDIILNAQQSAFGSKPKSEEIEKVRENVSSLKIDEQTASKEVGGIKRSKESQSQKSTTSLVIIGHVDSGKTTLLGRLLLDFAAVDKRRYQIIQKQSRQAGRSDAALSWLVDITQEERKRGVTITSYETKIETKDRSFRIFDAPGHRDFVPDMIKSTSQSRSVILVIDSRSDNFESGFQLNGQTKEHVIIARSVGIQNILVAINKMDDINWNEHRYYEIKDQMTEFLKLLGFSEQSISFVPCSGLNGDNISTKCPNPDSKWYKGDTLVDHLNILPIDPLKNSNSPLYIEIANIKSNDKSTTIEGNIESGTIELAEEVSLLPNNELGSTSIDCITRLGTKVSTASAGDVVSLQFNSISNHQASKIQIGDVITTPDSSIKAVTKFKARLLLFDVQDPIIVGKPLIIYNTISSREVKITKFIALIDKLNSKLINSRKKVRVLRPQQSALVELQIKGRALPLTKFEDNSTSGRIILRSNGKTVAAGLVEELL